jgi:4-phytase/acid phosphatase
MLKHFAGLACLLALFSPFVRAQDTALTSAPSAKPRNGGAEAQLRMVVVVGRHGVRSPTGKSAQYNVYSAAPWPTWNVAPGFLTPHGFQLMELLGAWERTQFAAQGLFPANGCTDTSAVTLYADSDERTRETAKALAEGLFPGCELPARGLAEGINDPVFHPDSASPGSAALAVAAISGRIGGDPAHLASAYHASLALLDDILGRCGAPSAAQPRRTSLFDIPATLTAGTGDHLAELKGPLATASTLTENLLLEYTDGMDAANVGWGCVDAQKVRQLMDLHTAATDFAQRTSAIAEIQAAPLLTQIRLAFSQAVSGSALPGALAKPSDKAVFLIGHDTNLENISGALHLTWIADGRRDDTPPGSALVFELWKKPAGGYFVRTYFTTQTLEQMRLSAPLTQSNPPVRVPVFIPACSTEDLSCPLERFLTATQ